MCTILSQTSLYPVAEKVLEEPFLSNFTANFCALMDLTLEDRTELQPSKSFRVFF